MTRIEALRELRDKVEAGEWWEALARSCFPLPQHTQLLFKANCGSLDAALALHEAVLGDNFPWSIGEEAGRLQGDPSRWCVGIFSNAADNSIAWVVNDAPARAWLLAVLSALIDMEASS